MKTQQDISREFDSFIDLKLKELKPSANSLFTPGTIERVKSYLENFTDKMKELNETLVDRANALLKESENNPKIELAALKLELFEKGKEAINFFVGKYKPG